MAELLTGGNMNAVERIGDTVHRTTGPWTPSVQRVLEHIRRAGIEWVPQPLGMDENAHEILSFLPGEVPIYPLPDWVWADSVLREAARRLRLLHDATMDFPRDGAVWQLSARGPDEVICHNDFAPHNLVFANGEIVGVIDFDTAAPGSRLCDLAYLATRIVPLDRAPDERSDGDAIQIERRRRIYMLLDAYGMDESIGALVNASIERLEDLAVFSEQKAIELGKPELGEHAIGYRLDATSLRRQFADVA